GMDELAPPFHVEVHRLEDRIEHAGVGGEQRFACRALQSSRQGGEIRIRRSVWPLPKEPDHLLTQIDLADGVCAALMLERAARFALGHGAAVGRSKTYCHQEQSSRLLRCQTIHHDPTSTVAMFQMMGVLPSSSGDCPE